MKGCPATVVAGLLVAVLAAVPQTLAADPEPAGRRWLDWEPLPSLPDPLGVAGAFVGGHEAAVIVAGGANFGPADAADLWELPKRYLADAFVLTREESGRLRWQEGFRLQ
jgi:solute:Na+ symporter, SSS family